MLNLILNSDHHQLEKIFEKEFDERKGISIIKNLNEELNDMILFYAEKIRNSNEFEEFLIKFVNFICGLFERIENLSKIFKKFENFVDLIYLNFYKVITYSDDEVESKNELKLIEYVFFKFWEILFKFENNGANDYFTNSEIFKNWSPFFSDRLSRLFHKFFHSLLDEENQIVLFTKFSEKFLPEYLSIFTRLKEKNLGSDLENNPSNFIDSLENVTINFDKIKFLVDLYFKNFMYISKDKIIYNTIYRKFFQKYLPDSSKNFEKYEFDLLQYSKKLQNLLKSNNFELILKMTRLLAYDKDILQTFLNILLSSLKFHFESIYQTCIKDKNYSQNLNLFLELKKIDQNLFQKEVLFFVDLNKLILDYKNSIYNDVLNNSTKEKAIFFSESFDLILRQKHFEFLEILLDIFNFGIFQDFSRFEDDYIRKMIERSIDEVFDKITETEIINKIVKSNKEAFNYSFKLQTAINNIKIIRSSFLNLVGIPSHCYSGINQNKNYLGCEPVVKDENLMKFFEKTKFSFNFPKNSKIILQQGWIEFSFVKDESTTYRSNMLLFSILKLVYSSEKKKTNLNTKIEEIIEYFEINRDLCNFLLENLNENKLIEYKSGEINCCKTVFNHTSDENLKNAQNNELSKRKIHLVIDLNEEFVKNKSRKSNNNLYNEFSDKHNTQILDCYIMKYLKKIKETSSKVIYEFVRSLTFMNNPDKIIRFDESKILERLNHLSQNSYITKINSQNFSYN